MVTNDYAKALMRRLLPLVLTTVVTACATTAPPPPPPPEEFRPIDAAMDLAQPMADEVRVRVVDVGGGLCTVTRTPGPHFMVYDAGHWEGGHCYRAVQSLVGNHPIDLLIVSHSDGDHFGDAVAILDDYQVRQIWTTGYPRTNRPWRAFHRAIAREVDRDYASVVNLQTVPLVPGTQIRLGPATVTIVAGWPDWTDSELNESEHRNAISIVARLDYEGSSVLLTGDTVGRRLTDPDDACKDAEAVMVQRHDDGEVDIDADVIIAAHHGGNNGNSRCFIDAVSPTHVVFSAGHDHQHPSAGAANRYLAAGVDADNMFRTDRGDHEPGPYEWDHGRIQGCNDPRGDDDVEIRLRAGQPPSVTYLQPSSGC